MPDHLLKNYPAANGNFDEMLDASSQPRAHWRTFLDRLAEESPEQMQQRIEAVQRKVRENGATYNVYDDTKGTQRPWDLNVLPLILPQDEWAGIEAAVIQRATLLNAILLDVYGEQKLLAQGLLPAALIHGHAGFLRPCHDIKHQNGIALHFYAVDLARAPNGRWWVVGDRTQSPSGAGYALENRTVIARAFPDLFRDLKVRYLAGFFATMRDSLAHWGRMCAANSSAPAAALGEHEKPLIVLLTPGPYNETYYEQTYLARYLGIPLVEGGDLTLSGLQRVHVIMRRVDDDFCDPLELRADSALGVAGLTEAARRGNVLIANSLGSNLLESGALLGFLPALSEHLLNEPLKMPSVGTWWCGEPAAMEEAIDKLDQLVIKPSFPQLRQFPVFGKDLQGEARENFIRKMRARPENFVAQDLVHLSQSPVWKTGAQPGLGASAIGLRIFACATPEGYVVMPGGLTRVATGPDARVLTMQRGGGSKDTWVQASGKVDKLSQLAPTPDSHDLIREETHLSSRVAENLYWFGRYSQRCDNVSRLTRTALDLLLNTPPELRGDEWSTIQTIFIWFGLIKIEKETQGLEQTQTQTQSQSQQQSQTQYSAPALSDAEIEAVLLQAVVSPDVPGLAGQLQNLYRIASHLRERLSVDNWRTLNQMMQRFGSTGQLPSLSDAGTILDEATTYLMTLTGFAMDGMTRDKGWRFMSIGRRIERLQFLCTILQNGLKMSAGTSLDWLLEMSDSIITYRSRYMARPQWLPVLDLLLLDENNPRSVVFQLEGLLKYMRKLTQTYGPFGAELLAPFLAELQALTPKSDLQGGNQNLIDLLMRLHIASETVSEKMSLRFFSYTGDSQQHDQIVQGVR